MTAPRTHANFWLDADGDFIGAAWFWPRGDTFCPEPRGAAVLIVPGIAHEERAMSGGVVALAESLAAAGLTALTIDLHGCAQSSGTLAAPEIGEHWRRDVRAALRHLHDSGFDDVIVVGVRLGALLALDALRDAPLLGVVAWAPIDSGRRHLRELKILANTGAADRGDPPDADLAVGGFDIPAAVMAHLAPLDLMQLERLRSERLLLLDDAGSLDPAWLAPLADRGMSIDRHEARDTQAWLFGSGEQPVLPLDDIEVVADWCRRLSDERGAHAPHGDERGADAPRASVRAPQATAVTFDHDGRRVRETFVEIGPVGLTAVFSESADGATRGHAARLLMSTVGPGRSFVDFARDEASRGNACLRFDFAGFGTSRRGASVRGGALYTDDGQRDVAAAVEHLRRAGHAAIVTLGFCAGAWAMLRAGALPGVRGAVAINVALYRRPEPPPAAAGERRAAAAWRAAALARSRWLRRIAARIERSTRARREPVEWLDAWHAAGVPVLLAYADHDPGLAYLRGQLDDGGLHERVQLRVYDGLGHLIEGAGARARMYRDVARFFAVLDRSEVPRCVAAPELRLQEHRSVTPSC